MKECPPSDFETLVQRIEQLGEALKREQDRLAELEKTLRVMVRTRRPTA